MEVIRDLDWCPRFAGTVVTLGEFDGVHRGHRVVLLETVRTAVVEGCPSVVVTYDPRDFADDPSRVPRMLTEFDHKLELIEAAGIEWVISLPSERMPSPRTPGDDPGPEWIVDEVMIEILGVRAVVVGEDYHLGTRRRQTIDALERRSEAAGFRVLRIPVESRRTAAGEVVSAQTVRALLGAGDVVAAADMLGRPHEIRSVVTPGERRGRTIGFPTVNLPTPAHVQLPAEGVYAAWYLRPNGDRLRAAVNIGRRPTFHDDAAPLVEAHLLDFSGDLYGETARLQFVAHLRHEEKFAGIDALKAQLARDVADVRERLPGG